MQTKNFLSVFMVIILATSGPLFLPLAYVSTALGETNTATTGADTPDASPTETAPAPTPRPGPVVAVTANKAEGEAPLQVFFYSKVDKPELAGGVLAYCWDLDGDGLTDYTSQSPGVSHVYENMGNVTRVFQVTVSMTFMDGSYRSDTTLVSVRPLDRGKWYEVRELGSSKLGIMRNGTIVVFDEHSWLPLTFREAESKLDRLNYTGPDKESRNLVYQLSDGLFEVGIVYGLKGKARLSYNEYQSSGLERPRVDWRVTLPEAKTVGDISYKLNTDTSTLSTLDTLVAEPQSADGVVSVMSLDGGPVMGEVGTDNPWSDEGITPYGEYFENNQEYVSSQTGFLTILATDLSIPGRGLDLNFRRVYAPPIAYEGPEPAISVDYSYQPYPWAPMGNGWMLGYPWVELNESEPAYIHLSNGQRYEWNGSDVDGTEYRSGDYFTVYGYGNGNVTLVTVDGTRYCFDSDYRPIWIRDTDMNTVMFHYGGGVITTIMDTIGRNVTLSYNGDGLVSSVSDGSRTVTYGYDDDSGSGHRLVSVTDPEDRVTGYGYFSDYLLNKTVYPTGGSTRYVYSVFEDSGYSKYRVSGQFMYPEELPLDPTIIELGSVKNIVELSEPHEYGWIWARTTSGYPGWYGVEKHTNTTSIHLQCETPGNYPADFYMGYLEWNTGRIPDNADVTKIYYIYDCYYMEEQCDSDIRALANPPSQSNATGIIVDYIFGPYLGGAGSLGSFPYLGDYQVVGLGANPMEDTLDEDFFGICMMWLSYNKNLDCYLDTSNNAKPRGILSVEYDAPVYAPYMEQATYVTYDYDSTFYSINNTEIKYYEGQDVMKTVKLTYWQDGYTEKTLNASSTQVYLRNMNTDETRRRIRVEHYYGSSPTPVNKTMWYDDWGNTYYDRDYDDHESYYSYANTNSMDMFNSSDTSTVNYFTDSFYTNDVDIDIHNRLVGAAEFSDGQGTPTVETYYSYDADGNLLEGKDLLSGSWLRTQCAYDEYGNLVRTTDPEGNIKYYVYGSSYGHAYLTEAMQQLDAASGNVNLTRSYGYDGDTGLLLYSVDENGNRTDYSYDDVGRVLTVTYPSVDGERCSKEAVYDDSLNTVTIYNEKDEKVMSVYDGLGRIVRVERFNGSVSYSNETYIYNWLKQVDTHVLPSGYNYTYTYDALGTLIRTVNPDGSVSRVDKDYVHNRETVFDEEGRKKVLQYDEVDRLVEVREYNETDAYYATFYDYDELGNLVNVSNGYYYRRANYTVVLDDLADAHVRGGSPDTNYGGGNLYIHEGDDPALRYGLIYFDTSSIPQDSIVYSANLSMYCLTVYGTYKDAFTDIYWIYEPWNEYTVTFNNAPGASTPRARTEVNPDNDNTYVDWDVSEVVQCLVSNPDDAYGFCVWPYQAWSPENDYYQIRSRSSGTPPILEVKYGAFTNFGMNRTTLYSYDQLGRLTRVDYPDETYEAYTYDDLGNMITSIDQNGNTTYYAYDSLSRLLNRTYRTMRYSLDSGSFPNGASYRKELTIGGSTAGTQTNYPIKVVVHYGSGTDSGDDVYTGGNCQSDFGDVRFTSSDGSTELDYWMQSKTDSDQAVFWVEVPSVPESPSTTGIYLYYGTEGTSTTTSSGSETFQFFDDFPGTSLDAQWTDTAGTPSVGEGYVTLDENNYVKDRIRAAGDSWSGDVQMHLRLRYGYDSAIVGRTGLAAASVASNFYSDDCAYMNPSGGQGDVNTVTGDDGSNTQWVVYYTYVADTWYLGSVKWTSSGVLYEFNGATRYQTSTVPNGSLSPRLEGNSATYDLDVDWVFVGKYVYPEPYVSDVGSEEFEPAGGGGGGSMVTVEELYTYDASGNLLGSDSDGVRVSYEYDARDRVLRESYRVYGSSYDVEYGYDNASLIESIKYPDNSEVSYIYDGLGRVSSVQGYAAMTYTVDDLVEQINYGNGVSTSYTYDERDRATRIQVKDGGVTLLDLRYGYDDSGSVTWIHDGTNNETYTYDLVDRLTASSGPWGSIGITYDAVGNRLTKSVGASTVSYTYDVMDMIVSATGVSFTWDGNGNMLTWDDGADEWGYRYDQLNRLVGVDRDGAASANYTYDADGRRVHSWDTVEGTTLYAYAGLNVLDEISGGSHERHVYAGSMQVASSDAGVVEYYHVDHLGSTRLKTNSTGGVVYVSDYEPFGPGYGEDGVEDYRYTGKREDSTGLYYYGARYYNPEIGRFTTRDKNKGDISDPHSLNQYIYCRDNPQKYTDPDGNIWNIVIGAGIGATVNVGSYWLQTKRNGEKFNWNTAATVAAEGAVKGGISAMCPGSAILAKSAFAAAASISSMYAGDIVRTFLHEDVKQRTLTDIAVTVAVDAGTTAGVSLAFGKVSSLKTLTANTVKVIENEVRPLSQQLTNYQFVPYSTPYEEKIADYTKSAAQLIVQTAYQIITSKGVSSSIYAMLDRDPDRNLTTNSNYSTSYGSVNCE